MSETQTDYAAQCRKLSERLTMIRGRGAFGVKPDKRTLSAYAAYQPVTIHHFDESTGLTTIETRQNVNPVANALKDMRSMASHGAMFMDKEKVFKHIGAIPQVVAAQLFAKGINPYRNEDWPKVAALLDSPDWAIWRTSPGKISKRPVRQFFTRQGSRGTPGF